MAVSGFDGSPEVLCTKEHCECGATLLSVDMTRVRTYSTHMYISRTVC